MRRLMSMNKLVIRHNAMDGRFNPRSADCGPVRAEAGAHSRGPACPRSAPGAPALTFGALTQHEAVRHDTVLGGAAGLCGVHRVR
ncbi:hypothetical protein QFZ58_001496 [Streptomyces sp. B1I3]|nr:hypothetical protein [Streptomyces sp. B1I3]